MGKHLSYPLVSVVLCTKNGELFLEEQLLSILNQTYSNLEIIVCDDASADTTIEIIRQYAKMDSRITCFFNPNTLGVNRNFEQGFGHATGQFIAIADQDDIWKPEKIEKQLSLFNSPETVLVHTSSARFSGARLPFDKQFNTGEIMMNGNDFRRLLLRNSIAGHNIMFRKSLIGASTPFPETVYYDWWLCQMATCVGQIAASPEVLAYHRLHGQNLTAKKSVGNIQRYDELLERINALKAFLTIKNLSKENYHFCNALLRVYSELLHKKFSLRLFFFYVKHAKIFFFYKRKKYPFFSYLKAAYYMSFAKDRRKYIHGTKTA